MKECRYTKECGFFINWHGNDEAKIQEWVKVLCCDDARADTACERINYYREKGELPPDNMSPSGLML